MSIHPDDIAAYRKKVIMQFDTAVEALEEHDKTSAPKAPRHYTRRKKKRAKTKKTLKPKRQRRFQGGGRRARRIKC